MSSSGPEAIVRAVAARYGIQVVCSALGADTWAAHNDGIAFFSATAISLSGRTLYLEDGWTTGCLDVEAAAQGIHEICHIVTNPPGMDIEAVDEGAIIIEYERQLARDIGLPDLLGEVIRWQREDTVVWGNGLLGEKFEDEENEPWWKLALDFLERHGWLEDGKPTYRIPV